MGIQIVHNQSYLDRIRIAFIEHLLDLQRPIFSGAMFRDGNMSFAAEWLDFHKYFRHAVSDVFIVNALRLPRFAWYRLPDFTDHLLAGFIHADNRVVRIIRQMIHLQNILHVGYKRRTSFWGDFPVFAEVRLKFVFFKTRCTVMCDTDSAKLSSTALSARSLTVQRLCPSGTSEQAKAISLASNAPSNLTSRGGFSLVLSLKCGFETFFHKTFLQVFNGSARSHPALLTYRKRSMMGHLRRHQKVTRHGHGVIAWRGSYSAFG